jgi:hypothetical protein
MHSNNTTIKNTKNTKNTKVLKKSINKEHFRLIIPKILPHQRKPIEYLVSKCRKQHGLIINHFMGTGKTFTSLFLTKNYPNKNIVLIIPNGLENIWLRDAKILSIDLNNITIIQFKDINNYYKYKNVIKDSILIIDEAHELINIIKYFVNYSTDDEEKISKTLDKENKKKDVSVEDKNKMVDFIETVYSSHKTLLLTGSLIVSKLYDIRYLLNLAAGKAVVPYEIVQFRESLYTTKYFDILYKNWFIGIIDNDFLGIIPNSLRIFINKYSSWLNPLATLQIILTRNANTITRIIFPIKPTSQKQLVLYDSKSSTRSPVLQKLLSLLNDLKTGYYTYALKKSSLYFIKIFIVYIITKGLALALRQLSEYYDENYTFDTLDVNKLKPFGKFVSFYKYGHGTDIYPEVFLQNKSVPYTDYQLDLWTRFISIETSNISAQEAVVLGLNKSITEADLFLNRRNVSYTLNGRLIGNIAFNLEEPRKFIDIYNIYINNNMDSTLVYSNSFTSGLLQFAAFLERKNIPYVIYEPSLDVDKRNQILDDFKNKKISMLLLHEIYWQGFSIEGVKHFHILEPVNDYYIKEQLITRVVRYKSHYHLKPTQRYVYIYQWHCSFNNVFEYVRTHKTQFSKWLKNDTLMYYFEYLSRYAKNYSPDDMLMQSLNKKDAFFKKLYDTVKKVSIDNNDIPDTCCIWDPDTNSLCQKKYNLPSCTTLSN